jgi:hypothetical protein
VFSYFFSASIRSTTKRLCIDCSACLQCRNDSFMGIAAIHYQETTGRANTVMADFEVYWFSILRQT